MPHSNPLERKLYKQRWDAARRTTDKARRKLKPFAGVDGEGGNINGQHQYLLLRAGRFVLETGRDLRTGQCLHFLSGLPDDSIYVGYFFTYDVTMILRDLSAMHMRALLDRESRTTKNGYLRPVRWGQWVIEWLPGKEFKVAVLRKGEKLRWVVISDVGSFFQCSFVTALERWDIGIPAVRARIAASKSQRANFGSLSKRTRIYNTIECRELESLMETFRVVCGEVGPYPLHWQGPGNLASAWLKYKDVPSDFSAVPYNCMEFARNAYYGGRFERTVVGPVRRMVYQYDINSAYPHVIRGLPCLVHGTWTYQDFSELGTHGQMEDVAVCYVDFSHPPSTFLGTLPIRNKAGNISYPLRGSGWYWAVEIEAAKRAGCEVQIIESWTYHAHCSCQSFNFIDEIYRLRRRVGKARRGNALKLAMNSLYGKMAQSVGHPRWANPIHAGLITATVRAMIIDACSQVDGKHVLMIATDGIFTDVPLDLPIGEGLGEWELKEHPKGIFIIQPGLYMTEKDHAKTRGVPLEKIEEYARQIRKSWNGEVIASVPVELNRFLAARQAVHQNKWGTAGTWFTEAREITFDWHTKRAYTRGWWEEREYPDAAPAFRPAILDGGDETVPYGKSIGQWELARSFEDDQPEEADVIRMVEDE